MPLKSLSQAPLPTCPDLAPMTSNSRSPVLGQARRLRRYVEGGGGLIVFAGDRVDPASYNTALAGDGGESLLPALLGEVRRADEDATGGGFRIRRLDRQHPILRGVADAIDTGAARVERFFSVTPQAEGGAVLAELDAGPLLLEKKAGNQFRARIFPM